MNGCLYVNRKKILKILQDNQYRIHQFGVRKIGLFGSFTNGSPKRLSDVDILVEFKKGQKTFDHYMGLKDLLERLLGRNVDLVIKSALKPRIKFSVLKGVRYAGL
jgi:hypothetical protein